MKNVTIYSTPTCHYCHIAKDYFQEHGISYTEHNVLEDIEKRKEMIQLTGSLGVPVIKIDNETFLGFQKEKIDALLGLAS